MQIFEVEWRKTEKQVDLHWKHYLRIVIERLVFSEVTNNNYNHFL